MLQGKDDDGHTLSLYRKSDMKLYAEYNGSEISTGLTLSSNCWHTVGLSFDVVIIPSLNPFPPNKGGQITIQPPNEAHLTIFVDDACYSKTILTEVSALQNMKFSIGRMFNESVTSTSFGDIKESYPLYGQIEMVAASSELCTSATLLQLEDDLNCMSKTNEYDDLGMLKNTYVYDKNDSHVMTLTRNYQTRTNDSMRISQRINMDTFAFGDESYWVRQYQYDAMGNVTKIYGETPDRHDYTYDYRNFLVNDNGTVYEYDGNGNITKKGTTTFTYDTVIKDRLVKVGNTPVTYSTANPLNPATYGNCSYNFKGRRLQSFTKSGSTYNYIYDEQGLRTRKIAPDGSVTKYLYNGTKLAAEIAPNYRLDFLYDENDMLYGFVKDGSAKYFYARDMLQNILSIIDTNGSPVVIYQYTAYGTSTVLQDTAGLASINPFRYKGYYFDNESGMYYCHTRYYVPEWCRWLNADHPSFLQPESLQEMNLFVYCGNNPITNIDPIGCFSLSILVVIGFVIGILVPEIGTAVYSQKNSNVIYYDSPDQLAQDWAQAYYNTSYERCSIIMTKVIDGKTKYYFERVYDGTSDSVAFQFYFGYMHQQMKSLIYNEEIYGFIHSHASGITYPSEADEFLKLIPGINVSYIASSPVNAQPYQTNKTFWQALWDMIKKIPAYL